MLHAGDNIPKKTVLVLMRNHIPAALIHTRTHYPVPLVIPSSYCTHSDIILSRTSVGCTRFSMRDYTMDIGHTRICFILTVLLIRYLYKERPDEKKYRLIFYFDLTKKYT